MSPKLIKVVRIRDGHPTEVFLSGISVYLPYQLRQDGQPKLTHRPVGWMINASGGNIDCYALYNAAREALARTERDTIVYHQDKIHEAEKRLLDLYREKTTHVT